MTTTPDTAPGKGISRRDLLTKYLPAATAGAIGALLGLRQLNQGNPQPPVLPGAGIQVPENTPAAPTATRQLIVDSKGTVQDVPVDKAQATQTRVPPTDTPPRPVASATAAPQAYAKDVLGVEGVEMVESRPEWRAMAEETKKQYANLAGLKPEEVSLKPEAYTDKKGIPYAFFVTNDGVPLLTYDRKEKAWKRTVLKNFPFDTGVPFANTHIKGMYDAFDKDFNLQVLGYDMAWSNIEVKRGELNFANRTNYVRADEYVNYALKHGMKIRGQNLVWYETYPEWLKNGKFGPDELKAIMVKHVKEVIRHFGGSIKTWIPANEFRFPKDAPQDVLRDALGPEYVDMAFQAAREADPSATLLYNDALNETKDGYNYAQTMDITQRLKGKGLIDHLGLQGHIDGSHPPSKEQLIEGITSYGIPVEITEFEVRMTGVSGSPQERMKRQAEIYANVVDAFLTAGVQSITFFGVGDKYSWLEMLDIPNWSGPDADSTLFDDNLQPKLSYYAVLRTFYNHLKKGTLA